MYIFLVESIHIRYLCHSNERMWRLLESPNFFGKNATVLANTSTRKAENPITRPKLEKRMPLSLTLFLTQSLPFFFHLKLCMNPVDRRRRRLNSETSYSPLATFVLGRSVSLHQIIRFSLLFLPTSAWNGKATVALGSNNFNAYPKNEEAHNKKKHWQVSSFHLIS